MSVLGATWAAANLNAGCLDSDLAMRTNDVVSHITSFFQGHVTLHLLHSQIACQKQSPSLCAVTQAWTISRWLTKQQCGLL